MQWFKERLPVFGVLLSLLVVAGGTAAATGNFWQGISIGFSNAGFSNSSVGLYTNSVLYGESGNNSSATRIGETSVTADGVAHNATADLQTADYLQAFNGTTWDRLRTTTSVQSNFPVGLLATSICGRNNLCADVGFFSSDGLSNTAAGQLATIGMNLGFNGTTWDRLRSQTTGVLTVTDAGKIRNKISTAGTTCTSIYTGAGMLATVVAAGVETASAQIYDEGASPTCAAGDLIYNKVPPNGTADQVKLQTTLGMAVKFSAAPAVNDYVTLSQ